MEINIGISECDKNVDNYYSRNIGSDTALAKRLSTVSSPFMVYDIDYKLLNTFIAQTLNFETFLGELFTI